MTVTNYTIKLKAVGPVHIGNGKTFGKKDYFQSGNQIAVIDPVKFTSKLNESQLNEYIRFLEVDSRTGLQDIFDGGRLPKNIAEESIAYTVNTQLATARRGSYQYLDVAEFVKDSYGKPYVPGSSVKGMLRTAILADIVRSKEEYQNQYNLENVVHSPQNADRAILKKAFFVEKPDPDDETVVNDVMRYISVSDSKPLSTDDLIFVKKYDRFSKKDSADHKLDMGAIADEDKFRAGNELNIYRECIRPGAVIELSLSIDDRINEFKKLNIENIERILKNFNIIYFRCFKSKYDKESPLAIEGFTDASDKLYCYLGGGVDFDSKTILNALYYGSITKNEANKSIYEDNPERLKNIQITLYEQFPTKVDDRIQKNKELAARIKKAGFTHGSMQAKYKNERLIKGKEDHRHWKDAELGVSPHTMKLGMVNEKYYQMGKCEINISESETQVK